MSQLLIQQYLNQLAMLQKVSGTHRESVVREAFKDLLKGWARAHDLIFVPEYEYETATKERRYVDGALLVGPDQRWLSTTGFLDKIDENLKKAMA